MTYKNRFVVKVKVNGKILRVKDDVVYLPFGSEYSIYLKNLDSRKASVKITIDDKDVLDNSSLIIDPNSKFELKGFLSGNQAKNKFRFIQKTKEIQEHRGDNIGDGLLRVEFSFEKPKPEINEIHHYHWNYGGWFSGESTHRYGFSDGPVLYSSNTSIDTLGVQNVVTASSAPLHDEGITVKGSEMSQNFIYATIGELEDSEVIVIQLKGEIEETKKIIEQPMTIQTKLQCSSCGRKHKSSYKYCPNCGTFLE